MGRQTTLCETGLIDTKHPALMHTSLSKDLTEKEELPTQLPNYGGRKAHVLAK